MWRKYLSYILRSYFKSLTYRSEILIWLILDLVPVLVLLLIWTSIFATGSNPQGYTLTMILQYYLIGMVIDGVISSHFEGWRIEEVRLGKVDYFFARPLPYLNELLLRDIGGKLAYLSFALPFFIVVIWLATWQLNLPALNVQVVSILSFLILVLGAYLVEFLIATTIVLLGFWFEGAEGLVHFKWIVITIASGSMLPIVFMPNWMQRLATWLPFHLMYAKPIGILQNTTQLTFYQLMYLALFIVAQLIFNFWLWQKARYRYASAGG